MPGRIRVGISGWTYAPWRGVFYPEDLPQKRELEYASRLLGGTLEINGTFYRMQPTSAYRSWYHSTPADFQFGIKGGRFITHIRRLQEPRTLLANFFASGPLALKEKLGPILWQLPPNFSFDEERIGEFLAQLPQSTAAAADLAGEHEPRIRDPYLEVDEDRVVRHAMEVRHPSFADARFVRLLRRHNVALVVAETAGKWPLAEDVTADFVYVRLHGAEQIYVSGYTDEQLDAWAARLRAWCGGQEPADARRIVNEPVAAGSDGREVYVYFDNTDIKLRAPFDALALMQRLGIAGDAALQTPPRLDTIRQETAISKEPGKKPRKAAMADRNAAAGKAPAKKAAPPPAAGEGRGTKKALARKSTGPALTSPSTAAKRASGKRSSPAA